MSALNDIAAQRVVPVIRARTVNDAVATARTCARAGLRVIELTRTTPEVELALDQLRDDGLILGIGTITDASQVSDAAAWGARFVVSFAQPFGLLQTAEEHGLAAIPGAFTPSEVFRCAKAGASAVKLFPGSLLEPGYLRALRAVMPDVQVMVTGGIHAHPDDISQWLDAGAFAVGLGTDLGTVAAVGAEEVERRARIVSPLARDVAQAATRRGAQSPDNQTEDGMRVLPRPHRGGECT